MANPHPESSPLISYQDFEQDPEAVIDNCNQSGESKVVTRNGRFLFLIEPLDSEASAIKADPPCNP